MMNKIVILALICSFTVFGKDCKGYIKACEETVKAQDKAIDNLKKIVNNVNEQLEEERSSVKWWQALIGGVLIGIITTKVSK